MNRNEFMELVYETFADEPDNVLANGIIEAADAYVEHEKAKLSNESTTSDLISRQEAIDEIEYVKAMKRTAGMTYTQHLLKNWRVAFHALNDFFAHFIHGLIPAIKIRHHQPYQEGKQDRCPHCGADMRGDNKDERFNQQTGGD